MSEDSKRQGRKTPNFDELMIDDFLVLRKIFTEDDIGGRSFEFELHDKSIGRLSTTTGRANERRRAGKDLAEIDYVLFTRPDVDVRKNDRVELTTKSLRVIAVNEPSNFDHHLEIELEDYQPDFKRRLFVSSNEKETVRALLAILVDFASKIKEMEEVSGALVLDIILESEIKEAESVTGDLLLVVFKQLASNVDEKEQIESQLDIDRSLIANVNEQEQLQVIIGILFALAAVVNEGDNVSGNMVKLASLIAKINEAELVAGDLSIAKIIDLASEIVEKESLQVSLSLLAALVSNVEDKEKVEANLSILVDLIADILEKDSLRADMALSLGLAADIEERENISANLSLDEILEFISSIDEKEEVSGSLSALLSLVSEIDEKEQVISALQLAISMVSQITEKEEIQTRLSLLLDLIATVAEKEQVQANLSILIDLIATVNEKEELAANLILLLNLLADINEAEEVDGSFSLNLALSSLVDEREDVSGDLSILLDILLAGSIDEKELIDANLVLDISLSSLIDEREQIEAKLALAMQLIADINEAEEVAVNLSLELNLISDIKEADKMSGALDIFVGLISSIDEKEEVDGSISIIVSLVSSIDDREQIVADMSILKSVVASVNEKDKMVSSLSIEISFIASVDEKELVESSLFIFRGIASIVNERDDLAGLVKISRALIVSVDEKEQIDSSLVLDISLSSLIDEREQIEVLMSLAKSLVASIDENEEVDGDLILEIENFLLALGHQQEPYLTMLDWDGEQIDEVGSSLRPDTVYSVSGWLDNGRRILAVAGGGNPNLVILEWDDDFTVLGSINLSDIIISIDSWWDNGNREIVVSTTDDLMRIVSWDGTNLSVLADFNFTSYAINMVSWWEGGSRIIAGGLLGTPNLAIYSWDGTTITELDVLDLGIRGWGIESFIEGGNRYILLGHWEVPRLSLIEWDGTDLIIAAQQSNPTMARDIHVWVENSTYYFALAGQSSPNVQIGSWDGASLSIIADRELSGLSDSVTGFREDATGDQLLFFGHSRTPRLTMLRWDGVSLSLEDTFTISGLIRSFHLFKPAALVPILAAIVIITDFGEYVIEDEFAFPADWTTRWDGVENAWFVAGWPTSIGEGALIAESVSDDNAISWDELDGREEPIDLLMQFRADQINFSGIQVILRGQDNPKQGYLLDFTENFVDLLARTDEAAYQFLASYEHGLDLGVTNWLRFTLTPLAGDEVELKARVWKSTDIEPIGWDLEAISDAITQEGFIGVAENEFNIVWRYYLAVGLGGASPLYPLFKVMSPFVDERELLEAALGIDLAFISVIDEKESMTSSLTKIETADLIAIGNDDSPRLSILRWDNPQLSLLTVFDIEGFVYHIDTWEENGNTIIAVGHSEAPRFSILKWDGLEITRLDTRSITGTCYGVHSWQQTETIRRIAIGFGGAEDPRVRLLSWDGTSLSSVGIRSIGGVAYSIHTFWENESEGKRGYAIAQSNSSGEPKFRILVTLNGSFFSRATDTFIGTGYSVHTWRDGNFQIIFLGKSFSPRAKIYQYGTSNLTLTELDTLDIGAVPEAVHSWWENGNRLIATSLSGAPYFAILRWDGTNLTTVDTIAIPANQLAGSQIHSWEDTAGDRLIATGYFASPHFSILKWDGTTLSEEDTFDKKGEVSAARRFRGKYIPIKLFASTVKEAESVSGNLEIPVEFAEHNIGVVTEEAPYFHIINFANNDLNSIHTRNVGQRLRSIAFYPTSSNIMFALGDTGSGANTFFIDWDGTTTTEFDTIGVRAHDIAMYLGSFQYRTATIGTSLYIYRRGTSSMLNVDQESISFSGEGVDAGVIDDSQYVVAASNSGDTVEVFEVNGDIVKLAGDAAAIGAAAELWEDNNNLMFIIGFTSAPFLALYEYDVNLSQEDTFTLNGGVNNRSVTTWEDNADRIIAVGHDNEPYLTIVRWDGISISLEYQPSAPYPVTNVRTLASWLDAETNTRLIAIGDGLELKVFSFDGASLSLVANLDMQVQINGIKDFIPLE